MARTPDETKKPARKPAAPRAEAPSRPRAKPRDAEAPAPRGRAAAAPRAEAPSRARAKPRDADVPAPRAEAPSRARAKPRDAEAPAPRSRARTTKGSPSFERPAPAPAKPKPRATTATVRAEPKAKAKPAAPATKPAAPKRSRAAKNDPGRLDRLVEAARKSLDDDKAENIVILDVTNRASYADRLIIATGFVGRQIEAMAAHLDQALAAEGLKLRRNAIEASEDWVLINAGDLIIHLFTPEGRLKFDLEKMWGPDSPLGESASGEQSPI